MTEERRRLPAVTGLARIPAPPSQTTVAPKKAATPVAEPTPVPVEKTVRSAAKIPTSMSSDSKTDLSASQSISFSTPVWIRTRLREEARHDAAASIPVVVLRAIENHVDDLTELVRLEQQRSEGTPHTESSLFPIGVGRGTPNAEPRAPETMRLALGNLRVIEDLVVRHHARNRSELITAALRAEFID